MSLRLRGPFSGLPDTDVAQALLPVRGRRGPFDVGRPRLGAAGTDKSVCATAHDLGEQAEVALA